MLDAERSLFATRQTLLDLNYARQVNEISLYTALGGGWQLITFNPVERINEKALQVAMFSLFTVIGF